MKLALRFLNLTWVLFFIFTARVTGQPTQPQTPQTASNDLLQDSIGVVKIKPNEPIHMACWLTFKGDDSPMGIDSKRGIEIAIDDKKGKFLDHPLKLTAYDAGCSPDGGRKAAKKIVTDPSIVAAIGSSCSSEAKTGVPILWKDGICTISPSNTAPYLTSPARERGFEGYLRTSHNDKISGILAAQFAYDQLKSRKAATVNDGSVYSDILQSIFSETFKYMGGAITSQVKVKPDQIDMKSILSKIAADKPDVIYLPIFIAATSQIVNQIRDMPGLENIELIGADASFGKDFYEKAKRNAIGMYHTSLNTMSYSDSIYTDFIDKYKKKYGEGPTSFFHAQAYDATMMIFAAIEKVAKKEPDGTLYIGRKALKDALFATQDFAGLTGKLTCDPWGDCGNPIIAIFKTTEEDVNNLEPPKNPYWKP